jgi:hypothetical protein
MTGLWTKTVLHAFLIIKMFIHLTIKNWQINFKMSVTPVLCVILRTVYFTVQLFKE